MKPDESPVTDADLASDRIIRSRIVATYPNDAILTEEGVDDEVRLWRSGSGSSTRSTARSSSSSAPVSSMC